jgi:hypothetical protein
VGHVFSLAQVGLSRWGDIEFGAPSMMIGFCNDDCKTSKQMVFPFLYPSEGLFEEQRQSLNE